MYWPRPHNASLALTVGIFSTKGVNRLNQQHFSHLIRESFTSSHKAFALEMSFLTVYTGLKIQFLRPLKILCQLLHILSINPWATLLYSGFAVLSYYWYVTH